MNPEVARIDDQNATLHRFVAPITVDVGDVMHINIADVCHHFDINGPAVVVGCRNDGHPVAEQNGSLISANATLFEQGECTTPSRPRVTRMCRTCWGEGVLVPPAQVDPVTCEDCDGSGEITE